MKNAVSEWMKDARDELKAAEYLHAGGFWKLACFHAQQAIDHSIPSTLEAEDIQFMASIYRGRYPGEAGLLPLGEPTRDDAERAIETARKAL